MTRIKNSCARWPLQRSILEPWQGYPALKRGRRGKWLAFALSLVLLAACGRPPPGPDLETVPAATLTATPTPTATATGVPTDTPRPVSSTPVPTRTATPPPAQTPATRSQAELPRDSEAVPRLLDHAYHTDTQGDVHVVGQVLNDTYQNLKLIRIEGSFYDQNLAVIAEAETYAYIDTLRPGEKAPFKLTLPKRDVPRPISSYNLKTSGTATTDEPFLGIQFVQHDASLDDVSWNAGQSDLAIVGEVTNVESIPAGDIRVSCALYDVDGKVLDVGMTYAIANVLEANQVSPFKLYISEVNGEPTSYQIITYGQEAGEAQFDSRAKLRISSTRSFAGDWQNWIMVGEVHNLDITRARFVEVYASYYDESNRLIAVDSSYAWRDILAPEHRSPFKLDLSGAPENIDHWQVWVQGTKTDDVPPGNLIVEDVLNVVSASDQVTLSGNVRNVDAADMGDIEVGVTIYDADRNIVAAERIWLEGVLPPGGALPFELEVQATESANSYQLYVQGTIQE